MICPECKYRVFVMPGQPEVGGHGKALQGCSPVEIEMR